MPRGKLLHNKRACEMPAIEHGNVLPSGLTVRVQFRNGLRYIVRFLRITIMEHHFHTLWLLGIRDVSSERRAGITGSTLRISVDHRMRYIEDRLRGAVIFSQRGNLRMGKAAQELVKGSTGGAAEAIDRLIGIAHGKDVLLLAADQVHKFDLSEVAILEFIDQEEFCSLLLFRQQFRLLFQQLHRTDDLLAERPDVLLRQQPLNRAKDVRDLFAA